MSLAPGDLGLDYSFARPDLAAAVRSGVRFVLRYTAGAASDPGNANHPGVAGKLITPGEFEQILAAGLDVIANDEWYESRITEGASAGTADALAAARLWKACGYAKGSTIYVSWDQNPSLGKFASVGRYARAYRKALGGYYQVDAYGGTGFLKWAINQTLIRFGWRPNAGSWSGDGLPYQPDTSTTAKRAALVKLALSKTPAHIWQTGNYWFSKSADENIIVRLPVGSHRESLAAVTPPVKPPVAVPPIPNPTDGKDLELTPQDKAYLDAQFKALNDSIRGAFSDSKGRPHTLRTWLSKAVGKKVDVTP